LVQEARELGMRSFNISGGEIFTYRCWKELLKVLVENGFDPFVTTKYPLNERDIDQLREIGIKRVNLSLDTLDRRQMRALLKTNDHYYNRILKTLNGFNNKGFELCIQSLVTSLNQDSMAELFNYLLDVEKIRCIKVRAVKFSLYPPGERDKYQWLRPDKNKLEKIKNLLSQLKKKHGEQVQLLFRDYQGQEHYANPSPEAKQALFEKRSQCPGNISSLFILPDGKVTLCEELYWHPRFILGDVRKQSLREIWNSEAALNLYRLSAADVRKQSVCNTCGQFTECRQQHGICWKEVLSAWGEENWDYPDPRCPHAPQVCHELWIK
jgi:radical SAM protein with 4Fe4S-binding SPASM domain